MRRLWLYISLCSLSLFAASCRTDPEGKPADDDGSLISFRVPEGWPQPVYNFESNPLTQEGFTLGRKLFYDNILSVDNTVSCGTCHQQFAAFSQFGHHLSHGVGDQLGTRNSPPIFNMSWSTSFFWDGGVNHIELQAISPITNPVEMGETLQGVLDKLNADEEYRQLFGKAFGAGDIDTQKLLRALAQFMGAMVSCNSRYDQFLLGKTELTVQERNGLALFQERCNSCHTAPLFTDYSFRNNGLALLPNSAGAIDSGRGVITPFDSGSWFRFKVPSLRNLKYSPPYMHDGRMATLEEVLEHYHHGIVQTPNLDPLLQNGIPLTAAERADLLAFLNTLNDETFVKDSRFAENQ